MSIVSTRNMVSKTTKTEKTSSRSFFDDSEIADAQLTEVVRQLSVAKFHLPFLHEAHWNARLQTTGGRFFRTDRHLDFNPKFAHHPDFEKIVLHELCHYHLYQAHRGFQHKDKDFKELLAAVGGSRFAPQLTEKLPKYLYQCASCGLQYPRQRKIDTKKYRCGKCRGRLQLTENKSSQK